MKIKEHVRFILTWIHSIPTSINSFRLFFIEKWENEKIKDLVSCAHNFTLLLKLVKDVNMPK